MSLVRVAYETDEAIVKYNVGAAHALSKGMARLPESAYTRAGTPKPTERISKRTGRPMKPRISIDEAVRAKTSATEPVAEKKAATESADTDNPSSDKEN